MVPEPLPEPTQDVEKLEPEPLVSVKRWLGMAVQVTELPEGTL
jgi:hypothetical protein